ncbi:hypothetical protein DS901_12570 [Loktanella sp. D2R18]|nr:hypothetical protein [Yoonia sp. 1_MG-2023]RBW42722.1 hypothetical protein DS901_12570 [Loktanella sp. D2R18]
MCLDYTQALDAQVLNCEAALLADGVTSDQLSYLPVIIAILGAVYLTPIVAELHGEVVDHWLFSVTKLSVSLHG